MWTADIVRHRFIEAAQTERRLPLGGGSQSTGFWPAYVHTFEDMNGWGTRRLAEEREMRMKRIPPSAGAISRHTEVMAWTAELIHDEEHRWLIWSMANCIASERSFSAWCKAEGMVRMTAYRRIDRICEAISANLNNANALLRLPDGYGVLQPNQNQGMSFAMMAAEGDDAPPISPTHWTDNEALEDRPDLRDFSWAQSQAKREAKRRQKLGLDAA